MGNSIRIDIFILTSRTKMSRRLCAGLATPNMEWRVALSATVTAQTVATSRYTGLAGIVLFGGRATIIPATLTRGVSADNCTNHG